MPGVSAVDPWLLAGVRGWIYSTPHYRICTTVNDPAVLGRFVRLMEAAHAEYVRQFPADALREGLLEIDLLATPQEFRTVTIALTGDDAGAYLRVGSGGYTLGERFVCRLDEQGQLFPIAAHEGLHQYMARHFRTRLPPSIEEGLATTFENVTATDAAITFDFDHNPRRSLALESAENSPPLPLSVLLQMHAGDVAGTGATSEVYYGECWLLAQVLTKNSHYNAGFSRFLTACATGAAQNFRDPDAGPTAYRPAAVWPALQPFLACDFSDLERDYGEAFRAIHVTPTTRPRP